MHSLNLEPKSVARQFKLLGMHFEGYPQDDKIIELEVAKAIESNVWPLVQHIAAFNYPTEILPGVTKLANFPEGVPPSEKWLNIFANHIATGKMRYANSFTEAEIKSMGSTVSEIYYALLAIKAAAPFIVMNVYEESDGEVYVEAMDTCMAEYHLVKTIGNYD